MLLPTEPINSGLYLRILITILRQAPEGGGRMAGQFFKNVIEGGEGVESGVVSDGRYFQMIVAGVG